VTDPRKASIALQWAVDEMTRRYKMLAEAGVRNIAGYNALVATEKKKPTPPANVPEVITVEKKATPPSEPPTLATEAAPQELPPAAADGAAAKKKRKLLIVDVAEPATGDARTSTADTALPARSTLSAPFGVPAPSELAPENPVESVIAAPDGTTQAIEA